MLLLQRQIIDIECQQYVYCTLFFSFDLVYSLFFAFDGGNVFDGKQKAHFKW